MSCEQLRTAAQQSFWPGLEAVAPGCMLRFTVAVHTWGNLYRVGHSTTPEHWPGVHKALGSCSSLPTQQRIEIYLLIAVKRREELFLVRTGGQYEIRLPVSGVGSLPQKASCAQSWRCGSHVLPLRALMEEGCWDVAWKGHLPALPWSPLCPRAPHLSGYPPPGPSAVHPTLEPAACGLRALQTVSLHNLPSFQF